LVDVRYYSFDQKIHQGQLVIDKSLVLDIQEIFDFALKNHFPIQSVIPLADKRFRNNKRWDDEWSMAANNTSAFNYRLSTGGKQLSKHAYGRAIDINPRLNPYVKGRVMLPAGATYVRNRPGTLTADHPLVKKFLQLGWRWGGHWKSLKDYQHFEK
jgi:peptidoglycan L-alanyl-D-glutamate endopeptidase CwlK